jgi:pyruvate dehydrogenase phosphatase regulatory subunit
MCSNDVDIPIGHIVHTGMQNEWGGYENDCSVARLAENRLVYLSIFSYALLLLIAQNII